jgi:hypothetical protein
MAEVRMNVPGKSICLSFSVVDAVSVLAPLGVWKKKTIKAVDRPPIGRLM